MFYPHFLLLFLLVPYCFATTLTFKLESNEKACFYAWVQHPGQKVQSGGSFDIDYVVTDPINNVIVSGQKERQVDYVFSASRDGEHSFCFSNGIASYAEKFIDFDISVQHDTLSVKAELPERQKGSVELTPLEESVYKLSSSLSEYGRSQKYIRTREHRNFETVNSTASRIYYFAIFESLLIVGMAFLQVFVVKTFFQNTKARI